MVGLLGAAAALLLVAAGWGKLLAPEPAVRMLGRAWPGRQRIRAVPPLAGRAAGLVEIGVGVAFLGAGGRVSAVLLGCCYVLFALVAVRLTRLEVSAPCGCFGRVDSPVGRAHLVLDLACVAVAVAAVAQPVGPLGGLHATAAWPAAIGAAQALLLAWLGYLSITALPALAAARRMEDSR